MPGAPALRVDREQGVIYGARVLGRYSANSHGDTRAENGTEYSRGCMTSALPLYENAKVKINHPPDRTRPAAERDVEDVFGVIRNVRLESDENGDPVVRADIHYRKHHELTADVLDDIDRRLGLWGLSHNAAAKRERFDRATKRLVIEELATVRSVDLVDKPATNRNLWESESTMSTTFRELLEAHRAELSKPRQGWLDRLLEMYEEDDGAMTAEAPAAQDPDEALKGGFDAACAAVLASDMSADEKVTKIKTLLKTHEKLSQSAEPEEVEESDEEGEEEEEVAKDKTESVELVQLRTEKKCRQLCESLSFAPTELQLDALVGLGDDKKRKTLIESFKGTAGKPGFRSPKSAPPGGNSGGAKKNAAGNRNVTESTAESDLAALTAG